jgi:polyisoprenoid-binding protein YceI
MHGISARAGRGVIVALAALTLASTGAAAQEAPKWIVDQAHSKLGFETQAMGAPVQGAFQRWDADIRFDPKQLGRSKVVVTIQTGSAVTGDAEHDQTAQGADWLASAMFPTATFQAESFKDLGGGRYEADGDLTIRGVSKPQVLPFTLAITGDVARMTGETTVDRSLFGVGQGSYGGADVSPLAVTVKVDLSAKLAG